MPVSGSTTTSTVSPVLAIYDGAKFIEKQPFSSFEADTAAA
jgi:hypothetical protein